MKKEDFEEIILNLVDLTTGYSESNNWIGFFERNKPYKYIYTEKAISKFLSYFENTLDDFWVAVSYYINTDSPNNEYEIEDEVINAEKFLVENNYISQISYMYLCKNGEICNDELLKLDSTFKIFKPKNKIVYKYLSIIGMCDSHVGLSNGHCFFISLKNDLIIYPHGDNTGYGCIGINDKKNNVGLSFLKDVSKEKDFDSWIYSEQYKKMVML